MHAVLEEVSRENEVAVFCVGYVVDVFAVDEVAAVDQVWGWDFAVKLVPLVEEGLVPVGLLAVLHWVPFLAPPAVVAVDCEVAVFWVEGDHRFFAERAGVVVQVAFVAPGESSFESAVRAMGRGGDL